MTIPARILTLTLLLPLLACSKQPPPPAMPSAPPRPIHEVQVTTIDGAPTSLAAWKGKTLLIVNTASRCGFTPQYEGLEALYQRYRDRGFVVLAFPSNDFLGQEPGSNEEIKSFCETRFKTTFPLFSKIRVEGDDQHPLYALLTRTPGYEGEVGWNFTKFLVDGEGHVVGRFPSKVAPLDEAVISAIERSLPPSSAAAPL